MSIRAMTRVWDHSTATQGALLVMLALADFADDDGVCWPDLDQVGHKARLSRAQVKNVIRDRVAADELVYRPGRGRGHRSHYAVMVGFDAARRAAVLKRLDTMCAEKGQLLPLLPREKGQLKGSTAAQKGQELPLLAPEKGQLKGSIAIADSGFPMRNDDPIRHEDPSWGGMGEDPPPSPNESSTISRLRQLGVKSQKALAEFADLPSAVIDLALAEVDKSPFRNRAALLVTTLRDYLAGWRPMPPAPVQEQANAPDTPRRPPAAAQRPARARDNNEPPPGLKIARARPAADGG